MDLVWSEEASNSLANIYFYIIEDSPQNAEMVIDSIIALAETLKDKRFEYSADPIIDKPKFRHISIWSFKSFTKEIRIKLSYLIFLMEDKIRKN